ncbi:MIT domain-containing protein 1 [Bactrocera dorsalis]|uniref:MIT domain-containing protein 1 n=1 Tax=Bactrocera dorsalis TaxID=27457 RepID=A0A6I9UWR1_BACDO|nr:MIT domain-containing protein 1 [Bactrocera dorsalis]
MEKKSPKGSKSTRESMGGRENCESRRERNVRDSKILKDTKEKRSEQRSERGSKTEHESRREHDRESRSERYSKSDRERRKDSDEKYYYESKIERNSRNELEHRRQHESKSDREINNVKSSRDMRDVKSDRESRDMKRSNDNKTKKPDHKTLMQDIKELIMRALECELSGHVLEARMLYEESLVKLQICTDNEQNEDMLDSYRKYLSSYEKHVQRLRDQIEQNLFSCKITEHIAIPEGSRGRSYEKLIGCYLNDKVSVVHIYEPCLTQSCHLEHFINFVEVLVKNCSNLMFLRVITRASPKSSNLQKDVLNDLREELDSGNISFNYQFDEQLKKPRIVFNNGVVIRCRRGLHIYKPLAKYYKLGLYDFDFRRCESAEVDIYQGKPFSESISKSDRTDLMESLLHA